MPFKPKGEGKRCTTVVCLEEGKPWSLHRISVTKWQQQRIHCSVEDVNDSLQCLPQASLCMWSETRGAGVCVCEGK